MENISDETMLVMNAVLLNFGAMAYESMTVNLINYVKEAVDKTIEDTVISPETYTEQYDYWARVYAKCLYYILSGDEADKILGRLYTYMYHVRKNRNQTYNMAMTCEQCTNVSIIVNSYLLESQNAGSMMYQLKEQYGEKINQRECDTHTDDIIDCASRFYAAILEYVVTDPFPRNNNAIIKEVNDLVQRSITQLSLSLVEK